ncbi:DUF3618 domain-containing protein [Amycolatopsis sp. 195334CR]|uniref:DUF3618 domain-containing protein n=1 Tax=Amycolatopsis sp. 195334CR TaxID=2814588 RepID=UPI001A8E122A|nr:DUF3618 domain-containing protein [Amycolatopsis sp. 195334CR]MBN6040666.1 DUF3618 domain-containing protein [Amycolatopsis sp. 195334CR]
MSGGKSSAEKAGFPHDAEQARVDIELTRQELGETVEALAHKVNVPARAKEQAQQAAVSVRRNPWPVAGGGAAVLALIVLLIVRRSRK